MDRGTWKKLRGTMLVGAVLMAGAGGSWSSPAAAETEHTAAEQDKRIAALEKRLAELEALLKKALESTSSLEVAELKRQLDLLTKELEKAKLGEAAQPSTLESRYGLGPAASKVYGETQGVSIGGYGETLYQDFAAENQSGERTGEQPVADYLRAVLYFGYRFNDTILFNSEIEIEHATTGEGAEEKGEVSLEFGTVDFLLSKPGNVRTGLFLVPVGFLNEMHEPTTFLGARRPDVETQVLPTTWRELGVGGFGNVGPFAYRGYVSTSLDAAGFTAENLRGGRQSGSNAIARDLAYSARGDFLGVPGLLAGASFSVGDTGQGAETAAGDVIGGKVTLYDVHAEYLFRGLIVRGLWTAISVDDAFEINTDILGLDPSIPAEASEGVGSRLTGWYLLAGYDVLALAGESTKQALIPFVRYERYDTQDQVPTGFTSTGANDVKLITYGVTWMPILNLAIKADFQDYDRGDGSGVNQVNASVGYVF
ncbi:MAG: hypothetical protein ACREAA_20115 [Candidatus Polarisedimenticolia bacterium]